MQKDAGGSGSILSLSPGQRSLVGYGLYSLKESGMTEHADTTTNDILILGACKYYFVWQK